MSEMRFPVQVIGFWKLHTANVGVITQQGMQKQLGENIRWRHDCECTRTHRRIWPFARRMKHFMRTQVWIAVYEVRWTAGWTCPLFWVCACVTYNILDVTYWMRDTWQFSSSWTLMMVCNAYFVLIRLWNVVLFNYTLLHDWVICIVDLMSNMPLCTRTRFCPYLALLSSPTISGLC